jgi:hypothetical protein
MPAKPKHLGLQLDALAQAFATPAGAVLFGTKATPGLFPNTASGKAAAREAMERGWLTAIRTETRGKASVEVVTITAAGSAFVMEHTQPHALLGAVEQTLVERTRQMEQLNGMLRLGQEELATLQSRVTSLAARVQASQVMATTVTVHEPRWEERLAEYLVTRQQSRPAEDCPLPELFHQARAVRPALSVGQFHEGLRQMHAQGRIALQPWTGPLHELPEPDLALMQGHSLAYYASPAAA